MGFKDTEFGSQESEVVDLTPPEDSMVEERLAAKRGEEKMVAGCDGELIVAKRPRAARQLAIKEAEAAEESKSMAKPAVAEKKPKMGRVPQAYIDWLLANPQKPLRPLSDELIDRIKPLEQRERTRAVFGRAFANLKALRDKDDDILEQYRLKGYAEEEITDDEGEM